MEPSSSTLIPYTRSTATEIPNHCLPENVTVDHYTLAKKDWEKIKGITIGRAFAKTTPCDLPFCDFCRKRKLVKRFYKGAVANTLVELWEISDNNNFDNVLQWMPKELLEDVWELAQKNNGAKYSEPSAFCGVPHLPLAFVHFSFRLRPLR